VAYNYRLDPTVRIAKIDGSKNEVDTHSVRIKGFPTLYFFRAGDKQNPMEYDGDRTKDAIIDFIDTFRAGYSISRRKQQQQQQHELELQQQSETDDDLSNGRSRRSSSKNDEL
jgi:protein disulfide-isomerase A1